MAGIIGIGSSPRKNGNSDILLQTILEGAAGTGAGTRALFLRDYEIKPCTACEACRKGEGCTTLDDGMQEIYPLLEESAGLVLVSPVYHYNVSGMMKLFIDRLYQYYDFTDDHPRGYSSRLAGQGRAAAVCVVGEQVEEYDMGCALEMLRRPIEPLGYDVVGELTVMGHFHKGKVAQDTPSLERAMELGRSLGAALTRS